MEQVQTKILTQLESSVIRVLLYFDVFRYPLRKEEIYQYLPGIKTSHTTLAQCLDELVNRRLIREAEGYYFFAEKENTILRRKQGNKTANDIMTKARKYSNIIAAFPFVEAVCISGSLSKGYIDEHGDIDYFIVTRQGKLWIARTFLIAFKKIFLFNRHKYFCLNYFIDTDHLTIPDRNIFTATELTTLLPMVNNETIENFRNANKWVYDYLPNMTERNPAVVPLKRNWLRVLAEFLLSNKSGDLLDSWFMKITIKRWKRKFGHLADIDFAQAMRSRKYVSKHHPQNFQRRVLERLEKGIIDFEKTHILKLHHNG